LDAAATRAQVIRLFVCRFYRNEIDRFPSTFDIPCSILDILFYEGSRVQEQPKQQIKILNLIKYVNT